MDIRRLDLNLLVVFQALVQEQNVTRAAERVGLSQPAMSSALGRLRDALGDPLFVRTSRGMLPTPRAEALIEPVSRALELIRASLQRPGGFDPGKSDRVFKLLMSDIGEIVYMPRLIEHLKDVAPGIRFHVLQTARDGYADALETGAADLFLGHASRDAGGLLHEDLFDDVFACMVRAGHPRIGKAITLEQYLDAGHVLVSRRGFSDGLVERTLSGMGLARKVALRVPHFLAVPTIVARTDLIVTVPRRLGEIYAQHAEGRLLSLPFESPSLQLKQYWHARFDEEPAIRWLRGVCRTLFRELSSTAPQALAS
jgi:DNA-binding transcriptional LysR family regulator